MRILPNVMRVEVQKKVSSRSPDVLPQVAKEEVNRVGEVVG